MARDLQDDDIVGSSRKYIVCCATAKPTACARHYNCLEAFLKLGLNSIDSIQSPCAIVLAMHLLAWSLVYLLPLWQPSTASPTEQQPLNDHDYNSVQTVRAQ